MRKHALVVLVFRPGPTAVTDGAAPVVADGAGPRRGRPSPDRVPVLDDPRQQCAVELWESRGRDAGAERRPSSARFPTACGRPLRRPPEPARPPAGVHRPGRSTAPPAGPWRPPVRSEPPAAPMPVSPFGKTRVPSRQRPGMAGSDNPGRQQPFEHRRQRGRLGNRHSSSWSSAPQPVTPPAPRRRLRPACGRPTPSADARGCRTPSTPRSPARPRTRRATPEDTPPRTSATATAAR